MTDYTRLLDDMSEAAREAGEAILEIVRRGFEVEAKSDASPVTEADRAAELIILAALARAAPGVPVIAEEEVAAGRIPTVTRLVKVFSELENDLVARAHADDPRRLDAMLDPAFEMRVGATPGVPLPRDEWIRAARSAPRGAPRIDQMAVHDFGTVAIVSFRETPATGARRKPQFVVDCWKRAGDEWKLAVRYVGDAASSSVKMAKPPGTIDKRY